MSLYDYIISKDFKKHEKIVPLILSGSTIVAGVLGVGASAKGYHDVNREVGELQKEKVACVEFVNMVDDHAKYLLDLYTSGEISYNEYKGLMTDVEMYRYVTMETGDNYTVEEVKEKIEGIDDSLKACKSDKIFLNIAGACSAAFAVCGARMLDVAKREDEVDEYLEQEQNI